MSELFNATEYLVSRRLALGDGAREAVRSPSGSWTYAELDAEVRRVQAGLAALGVQPEQRVVLCMVDEIELFTAILATMRMGAVAVPVSTMLRASELSVLLADSRSRLLLCSATFADTCRDAVARARDAQADLAAVSYTHLTLPTSDLV